MEENEDSIKDMLKELLNKKETQPAEPEEDKKKDKPWKIPFKGRVSVNAAKKGYTTVQIIRNNGEIDFSKSYLQDGTILVDGIPRVATIDYRLSYKGKPFIIIPEWSLKPFSPADNYEQSIKEKMNATGSRAILARLQSEAIKPKKEMGNMVWWIIGGIVVIALVWYMFKGGGKLF